MRTLLAIVSILTLAIIVKAGPPAVVAIPPDSAILVVRSSSAETMVRINGAAMQQRGTEMLFVTPPLDAGRENWYSIDAVWNGEIHEREVRLQPGRVHVVDFRSGSREKVER